MGFSDALRETRSSRHGLENIEKWQVDAHSARRHYRVTVSRSNIGFAVWFKVGMAAEKVLTHCYPVIARQSASAS
jgi:hypothetical protein